MFPLALYTIEVLPQKEMDGAALVSALNDHIDIHGHQELHLVAITHSKTYLLASRSFLTVRKLLATHNLTRASELARLQVLGHQTPAMFLVKIKLGGIRPNAFFDHCSVSFPPHEMPVSINLPVEPGIWTIGFPLLDSTTLAARIQDAFDSEKDNIVVQSVDICPPALILPVPSTAQELKTAMSSLLTVRKRNATAGTSASDSTIVVSEGKRTKRRKFFRIRQQSPRTGGGSGSDTARVVLPDADPEIVGSSNSLAARVERIAVYTAEIASLHQGIAKSHAAMTAMHAGIAEWNNKIKDVLDEM